MHLQQNLLSRTAANLSAEAAAVVGSDIVVTATSASDLSDPARFGVEYKPASASTYLWSLSEPGQVSSQSISVALLDDFIPTETINLRPYYTYDSTDQDVSARAYGAALSVTPRVAASYGVYTITGQAASLSSSVGSGSEFDGFLLGQT